TLRIHAHAYACGRARGDHVARHQGHQFAHVAYDRRAVEDHFPGIAALYGFTVQLQPDIEGLWVAHIVGRRQPRANRPERIEALALVPRAAALELEMPLGHVVHHAITRHVRPRLVFADIPRPRADHDSQFDFPIDLLRLARQHHVIVRADHTRIRLHEDDGFGGDRQFRLVRVIPVIQANADELPDVGNRRANAGVAANHGQCVHVERREAFKRRFAQCAGVDIWNHRSKVADRAIVVEDAGLFLARGAVAKKFHMPDIYLFSVRATFAPNFIRYRIRR